MPQGDDGTDSAITEEQVRIMLYRYNQSFYDGALDFTVAFRALKRRAGQYQPGDRTITISQHLLEFPLDRIRTILKHELAHAAVHQLHEGRRKPHGQEWKLEMGRMGIQDPDTTHDMQLAPYRYVFECTGCGQRTGRYRSCRFVEQTDRYRCGDCGDRFEQIT